jgi:hypothetical protein
MKKDLTIVKGRSFNTSFANGMTAIQLLHDWLKLSVDSELGEVWDFDSADFRFHFLTENVNVDGLTMEEIHEKFEGKLVKVMDTEAIFRSERSEEFNCSIDVFDRFEICGQTWTWEFGCKEKRFKPSDIKTLIVVDSRWFEENEFDGIMPSAVLQF